MKFLKHWLYSNFRRVDIQVSVFMAVVVFLSSLLIYVISYKITYNSMITSLNDRVVAIHRHLEREIDPLTFFAINTKEDMEKPLYKDMKHEMEKIKRVTDVMYLYTAKVTGDGDFIYVIDGLDEKEDFRYPGDLIEKEIYPYMRKAMGNNVVLPDKIKETDWGKIFITYFPFHDDKGKVIGVIGIEIEAENQYDTYFMLRMLTPISIVCFALISIVIAMSIFRRISNPTYQDMANTDQLTKLKSRNAFEISISNMISMRTREMVGVIVVDLDKLKKVNDALGHEAGDKYICQAAQAIQDAIKGNNAAYRTGGDEFTIICQQTSLSDMGLIMNQINDNFANIRDDIGISTSMSMGMALFDESMDDDIRGTYRRADILMYEQKRIHHKERETK